MAECLALLGGSPAPATLLPAAGAEHWAVLRAAGRRLLDGRGVPRAAEELCCAAGARR